MADVRGKRQCVLSARFFVLWICLHQICIMLVSCEPATDETALNTAASLTQFVDKLPTMRRIRGYAMKDGKIVPAGITIGMYIIKWKFHKELPPATVYAYGTSPNTASVPGPTIEAFSGVDTFIRWENHLYYPRQMLPVDQTLTIAKPKYGIPTVVHLHGSLSEPESDGHSEAWFTAGFNETGPTWTKEVYHYSNAKAGGNFWYHDHAMGYTRLNILSGLLGAYVIRHPTVEDPFNLPMGRKYDRHLVIFDRSFGRDGSLYMNPIGNNPTIHPEWQPEYFGDVIVVNGKAWPYLKVARRKYRFRVVNSCNARFLLLSLDNGLPFIQIASDSYYLEKPLEVKEILLAPSEIADFIVDFTNSPGSEILLTNGAAYPFPDGDAPTNLGGKIMKFIVEKKIHQTDPSTIPTMLVPVRKLLPEEAAKTRNIVLFEYESDIGEPTHLLINFRTFDEPATETPKQGTTELWHIINLTGDNHPLHMHLAGFQVLSELELIVTEALTNCMETLQDVEKCNVWGNVIGKPAAPPPTEAGWKNVYKMKPSFITSILIRFSQTNFQPFPFDASAEPGYVYHCHILDHEDNSMMRPFKIMP